MTSKLTVASAMQNMVQPKSTLREDRPLPSQQEGEEEKPLFCPTGYPDHRVYGPLFVYNGFATYMRWSAMHTQVHGSEWLGVISITQML